MKPEQLKLLEDLKIKVELLEREKKTLEELVIKMEVLERERFGQSIMAPTIAIVISEGGEPPNTSAIFQLASTRRGFLPPRMTSTERDAVISPATGLIIYNTTTNKLNIYNGTTWKVVTFD